MLDENTKITLRNALIVIAFVISIVSGYFYTLGKIEKRLSTLENDQKHFQIYQKETNKRLDDLHTNQIKIMVALGVDPAKK